MEKLRQETGKESFLFFLRDLSFISVFIYVCVGKAVIAKDTHKLKCARRGQDEAMQLLEELNDCKAKYGPNVLPIKDKNKELKIMFFESLHMQQAFKCFPEVVLLDATYSTNKLRAPLFS